MKFKYPSQLANGYAKSDEGPTHAYLLLKLTMNWTHFTPGVCNINMILLSLLLYSKQWKWMLMF